MTKSTLKNETIHGRKLYMVVEEHRGMINDYTGPYEDLEDAFAGAQTFLNVAEDCLICEIVMHPIERVSGSIKREKLR